MTFVPPNAELASHLTLKGLIQYEVWLQSGGTAPSRGGSPQIHAGAEPLTQHSSMAREITLHAF